MKNKYLLKHVIAYAVLVVIFLYSSFIAKSEYFYHPYPNLVEYFVCILLLIYTLTLLIWNKNRRKKMILGTVFTIIFLISINVLNHVHEWHPLRLNLPFSSSQSFKVNYEPFAWPQAIQKSDSILMNKYYKKIKNWKRLRSLIVVQNDSIVTEKYFNGADKYDAFNVHSITKSVTSALVGIAIEKGYIGSEHDKVISYFPAYKDKVASIKHELSIAHLLTMKGGFDHWDALTSTEETLLELEINKSPGEYFKYFSGSQGVLSSIITETSGLSTKRFAEQELLAPIGIKNAFWRKQDSYYCGGSESYYTPRDLARLGQLYLKNGKIDSVRILSREWIKKSFTNYTDSSKYFRKLHDYEEIGYGYCWWLLKYNDHIIYTARGKGGQYIMLLPEINSIIVIVQEWNLGKEFETENKFLCELLSIVFHDKKKAL